MYMYIYKMSNLNIAIHIKLYLFGSGQLCILVFDMTNGTSVSYSSSYAVYSLSPHRGDKEMRIY